ncbi:hypothetical protein C8R44DRAFT_335511 [Mycena epipterygia]|nr:hypothetical protein C8R44DRAFT_335511 [Mycena epipterygia]
MPSPSILGLLEEPFGPYQDSDILDPAYHPKGKQLPQLRRLRLRQDDQSIGLDICERHVEPPEKASSPVFFFGILIIEKLVYLSDKGKRLLKAELNDRDAKAGRASQNSRKLQLRQLTLEGLYGQTPGGGSKIKVWIRCEKESGAMYMTDKDYPTSLLLKSKDQHRCYEIITIDRSIYERCRNFLERYRLVALIAEIVAQYDLPENTVEVDTLVEAYLRQHKSKGLSYAVIFSEEGNPKPLLRHVSHAEVRAIFAAHAGWLLSFYLVQRKIKCPIDIGEWCKFIGKVRVAKRAARSGNWSKTYEDPEIWGSDADDSPASIAKTLEKFGGNAANWEKRLINAITNRSSSRLFADDDLVEYVSSGSKVKRRPNYDPDFSEPSTPGCSDSEYDSESSPFPSPRILLHMYQAPVLLPGRFKWDCPIPKCMHSIDFLNLTSQDIELIKPPFDVYIGGKQYNDLRDENVQTALCQMVSHHYCQHLHLDSTNLTHQKKNKFISELSKKWR